MELAEIAIILSGIAVAIPIVRFLYDVKSRNEDKRNSREPKSPSWQKVSNID